MDYNARLVSLSNYLEALRDADISKTSRYIAVDAVREHVLAEGELASDPILYPHSALLHDMTHGRTPRNGVVEYRIIKEMINRVHGLQAYQKYMDEYLASFIEDVFDDYFPA